MSQMTPERECLQMIQQMICRYADDTLYQACKASQRHAIFNSVEKWSSDANLILTVRKQKDTEKATSDFLKTLQSF